MNYIEVIIEIPVEKNSISDIIVAFLAEQGFESFSEENNKLFAYVQEDSFLRQDAEMLLDAYNLKFEIKIIEQQNWNAEWEKNFSPIVIDNILAIKAPFHSEKFDTQDTIIIEPKMSFGTGHHATTHMMCKLISEYDFSESVVLDMGCGTGILAIYASMLGAAAVTAIDIDEWSYENTIENAERNNITNIATIRGDVKVIPDLKYDFIFANINLNVLKNDMSVYVKYMHKGSILLLSGFFTAEIPQIESVCKNNGLLFVKFIEMDNWSACVFNKI